MTMTMTSSRAVLPLASYECGSLLYFGVNAIIGEKIRKEESVAFHAGIKEADGNIWRGWNE